MLLEGNPENEIKGEQDGNDGVEEGYEIELDKLCETLCQAKLCGRNSEVQRDAALWYSNSTAKSVNFAKEGSARKVELNDLIKQLTPYRGITYFGDQLRRAETLMEEVSAKLYSTPSEKKAEKVAFKAATPAAPPIHKPPYKIVPPKSKRFSCVQGEVQ